MKRFMLTGFIFGILQAAGICAAIYFGAKWAIAGAIASAPVREDLEQAARTACADKGLTLRALVIFYDEQAEPTGGKVVCGPPMRQDV